MKALKIRETLNFQEPGEGDAYQKMGVGQYKPKSYLDEVYDDAWDYTYNHIDNHDLKPGEIHDAIRGEILAWMLRDRDSEVSRKRDEISRSNKNIELFNEIQEVARKAIDDCVDEYEKGYVSESLKFQEPGEGNVYHKMFGQPLPKEGDIIDIMEVDSDIQAAAMWPKPGHRIKITHKRGDEYTFQVMSLRGETPPNKYYNWTEYEISEDFFETHEWRRVTNESIGFLEPGEGSVYQKMGIGARVSERNALEKFAEEEGYRIEVRPSQNRDNVSDTIEIIPGSAITYTVSYPRGWDSSPMSLRKVFNNHYTHRGGRKQYLVGRFSNVNEVIRRIKISIENETKKILNN